jgi:hypothetical protein
MSLLLIVELPSLSARQSASWRYTVITLGKYPPTGKLVECLEMKLRLQTKAARGEAERLIYLKTD